MQNDILNQLIKIGAPSNFEFSFQNNLKQELSKFCETIEIDTIGNLIAFNVDQECSLMITAHCDEVGFIVKYIDSNGFISICNIGGNDVSTLECLKIDIYHGDSIIRGFIAKRTIESARTLPCDINELWVDIGCTSREQALERVSIGDFATYHAEDISVFGTGRIGGKSLDNRVGVYICSQVLKQVNLPICFVSSVQEEIGLRGISTAITRIKPLICIVVDVTFATDFPGCDKKKMGEISLGYGPVIPVGANVDRELSNIIKEIAVENAIPYQIEVNPSSSGTDARTAQISGKGVKTGIISIPLRYMHSPVEIVDETDIVNAISLLKLVVEKVGKSLDHYNHNRV